MNDTNIVMENSSNDKEEEEVNKLNFKGYQFSWKRCTFSALIILLTFGLVILLVLWREDIKMFMFYTPCPMEIATKILVKDEFDILYVEDVWIEETSSSQVRKRSFVNKKVKYIWEPNDIKFIRSKYYDEGLSFSKCKTQDGIHSFKEFQDKFNYFGPNLIEITILPIYKLIFEEVGNPYYLFQLYAIIIWTVEEYFSYSSMLLATTVIAVGFSVYQTRKQTIALKKMHQVVGMVTVIREEKKKIISTMDLVPGDVICIDPALECNTSIYCDVILLEGTCSMDESMLTGESHPIAKLPIPHQDENDSIMFDYGEHKRHILYCGTQIVQGRSESNLPFIKALVIRTGFSTSKGELMRAILYPKPIRFQFYTDLIKVTALFLTFGLAGMGYTIYSWIRNEATIQEVIMNSLDIMTFVVPPMLPAALTATTSWAQRRLAKDHRIFCLSAKHISLAGGVDVVCFDKTGTLTEVDVDLAGVVPIKNDRTLVEDGIIEPSSFLKNDETVFKFVVPMATAHSLIIAQNSTQLSGYSIDQKLFHATGWILKDGPQGVNPNYGIETPFLVEPKSNSERNSMTKTGNMKEVAILKRFPFESKIKMMTVITQQLGSKEFVIYIKGAPERVADLCDPRKVPSNYYSVLKHYTSQGYRVLAMANKTLNSSLSWSTIQQMSRKEVESNPELIGLLIMQNPLKKETNYSINLLHQAALKTIMVTGDNLQTAVSVAKDCHMVDQSKVIHVVAELVPSSIQGTGHLQVFYNELQAASSNPITEETMRQLLDQPSDGIYCMVMEGPTFKLLRQYDSKLLDNCIKHSEVFARMDPIQKQQLVEALQHMGHQVAMVGDGCNDCSALRTADTGISLSTAEASVAAPFTSQETNISCVEALIREGRTTLSAALCTFQFSVGYCFVYFIGSLFLYTISSSLSDIQYFLLDFGIAYVPFFTLGNVAPAKHLTKRRPLRHLWGFLPMFSFFTFLFWQTVVLLAGWFLCVSQPWFEPYIFEPGKYPPAPSYEETIIFFLLTIGIVSSAFVFSPGAPYSRNPITNRIFAVWTFIVVLLIVCLMGITQSDFVWYLNFKPFPHSIFTFGIFSLGLTGGIICYCWEKYLVRGFLHQQLASH